MHSDEYYMLLAIKEAKKASKNGDIPIGSVIVYEKDDNNKIMTKTMKALGIKDGDIVSKAYNKRNKNTVVTAHAEILAIEKACKKIHDFRLENCVMYVTLEPCQMCAGAILQSRMKRLIIGTKSLKSGSCGSIINILDNDKFNHKVTVEYNILEEECKSIIQDFFKGIRK